MLSFLYTCIKYVYTHILSLKYSLPNKKALYNLKPKSLEKLHI